ncbi:alpha/beta hydrolase [Spongiactinospora gelatinilytica]|uniref:Alpha/beta hydrolase n=1 Tax=Spongiactinospora gelatinilytica TaxID=2666298 RepID=A0A2W2GLA0_9ACTN|nr:alpha/beta hydrolase [Spongiactinospora gelatinilytica]PZG40865.1 alpha/beta hydrolase [Spongiactinospora gelatinilytica]
MSQRASANGIEIAYESFGSPRGRPVLLIMGLATQMIFWDDDFCAMLAARGHHVVRFDNRDVGLSTHLTGAGAPELGDVLAGRAAAPYLIEDMAADAAGLMDALGRRSCHVVGASMGGMIAQALAIGYPSRVRSLTSIMSTPAAGVGPPTDAAISALLAPPATDRDDAVARALEVWSVIGSPGYPLDRERIRRLAGIAYDRSGDPAGSTRQFAAILASPDRRPGLARLALPALVVHGRDDQLIQLPGGLATAEAIPGARLRVFPGMGHDLPYPLWDTIISAITRLTEAAETERAA